MVGTVQRPGRLAKPSASASRAKLLWSSNIRDFPLLLVLGRQSRAVIIWLGRVVSCCACYHEIWSELLIMGWLSGEDYWSCMPCPAREGSKKVGASKGELQLRQIPVCPPHPHPQPNNATLERIWKVLDNTVNRKVNQSGRLYWGGVWHSACLKWVSIYCTLKK